MREAVQCHSTGWRRRDLLVAIVLCSSLGLLLACSTTVPATITMRPTAPIKRSSPFFVVTRSQRESIEKSLGAAGLQVSDDPSKVGYSIEVRIGGSRGSRDCGTVNNVVYIVTAGGQRVMVIKGRGPTGSCSPNIFDDLSKQLAANTSD
jgi:hypothetical protein